MDDTYLKTIFWLIVLLYTLAIIGVWENFAKPVWGWAIVYLGPFLTSSWQSMIR
jgi:hypothetical protein